MGRSKQQKVRFRGSLPGICVLGLSLWLASGCNEHPVGTEAGPEFRGITVPLPPPSFRSATTVDMAFSGMAPGFENERVVAWDTEQQKGIAASVDPTGAFALEPWGVNVQQHCIEVRGFNRTGRASSARYYALNLAIGATCQAPGCSVQDEMGECLCLLRRTANCVDAVPWPDANTGSTATASGGTAGSAPGASTGP